MFCYQCEQTAKGEGCTIQGVCGKKPEVAALQDLLTYALKGLAVVAHQARPAGVADNATDRFMAQAMFSTLTNVDFDPDRFVTLINKTVELREALKAKLGRADWAQEPANFKPTADVAGLVAQGEAHGFQSEPGWDPDAASLRDTVIFGLRGVAAYADHAAILGQEDDGVYAFLYEGMAATLDKSLGVNDWVGLALKTGEVNLKAMELLDAGNTGTYGHPVPTSVPLGHKAGKAILVSGHDLKDLEDHAPGADPGQGPPRLHPR